MTSDQYKIYLVNHKNTRIGGSVELDPDGFASIYINARRSYDQQLRTFDHEIMHLEFDDLHNHDPIEVVEARAADKEIVPTIPDIVPDSAPKMPSFAEQWEAIYQRGKDLFGIERDAWVWNYLFELWFNRDSKLKYTTIMTQVFKQYSKAKLGTMLNRIFRDYFLSIGREP